MSSNQNQHEVQEDGVVFVEIAEIVREAEKKREPWPELDEPVFSDAPLPRPGQFAERVMWTMVALIGAVTIYGITTGRQEILMTVLAIAAGALLRLAGLTPGDGHNGEKHRNGRTKGPKKKRGRPG